MINIKNNKITIQNDVLHFYNIQNLEPAIQKIKNKNIKTIIIDFQHIEKIDFRAISNLLYHSYQLKKENYNLEIVNINSDYIKNIFQKLNLNQIFKTKNENHKKSLLKGKI